MAPNLETNEDETASDEAEPVTPDSSPGSRRPWLVLALAAVCVVALAVAAVQWRRAGDLEDKRDDRFDVAATAGTFSEALFSYDFENVSEARERVLALVTGDLAERYEEEALPGLEDILVELQARTEAHATDVFVTEVGRDDARAIVAIDLSFTSTATGAQNIDQVLYLKLDLVRLDDGWRIEDATYLVSAEGETGETPPVTVPPDATTTTSTP